MSETKIIKNSILQFTKLSENATAPTRASEFSAGLDLYSAGDFEIKPNDSCLISTDLSIAVPCNCYGRIAPRSGLALKHSLNVFGGVVDCDYRGVLKVILFNHGQETYSGKKGDRIAQLICEKIEYPQLVETQHLDETSRGSNGFGSSGK